MAAEEAGLEFELTASVGEECGFVEDVPPGRTPEAPAAIRFPGGAVTAHQTHISAGGNERERLR